MRVLMWPTALLIAAGVPAANSQVQSPSPALSDQSPDLSDLKLDAVPRLTEQLPPKGPSKKERIAFEAINALANAVTDQGLSLKEYDSILEVAQNDPRFAEKSVSAFVLRPSRSSSGISTARSIMRRYAKRQPH